jgi:hypothetical protein
MTERERILEHAKKQIKRWEKVRDNYEKEYKEDDSE